MYHEHVVYTQYHWIRRCLDSKMKLSFDYYLMDPLRFASMTGRERHFAFAINFLIRNALCMNKIEKFVERILFRLDDGSLCAVWGVAGCPRLKG